MLWKEESCKHDACLRQRQVVGGAERPVAQFVEVEARSPTVSPAADSSESSESHQVVFPRALMLCRNPPYRGMPAIL